MIRSKVLATVTPLVLFLAPFLAPSSARAAPQVVEVPSSVGSLPDISAGSVTVDKENVRLYRGVLPEPLFDLVSQGELVFSAAKSLQFAERFVDPFVGSDKQYRVSEAGELIPAPEKPRGIFFASEGVDSAQQGLGVSERAYRALWNSTAGLWRHGFVKTDLSLVIFKESLATGRQVKWRVERIYPAGLGQYPGTLTPLFREKISAIQPALLEGMRWLTIRSVGRTDDYVWAASPITGSVRQMTGSNRADDLFTGAFAADDLFVWSGKVELVQPQRVTSQVMLVPFITRVLTRSSGDAVCENRASQEGPLLDLNQASRRYAEARGWVPTNVLMAPRRVTQVDIASRDPLAPDGSVSLFIDEQSGVPVYKIVWGRNARMQSFVIGVMGAISVGSAFQPLPLAQIIVRPLAGERAVLSLDSFTTCSAMPTGVSYNDFDPVGLSAKRNSATPSTATRAAQVDDAEDEEVND